MCRLKMRRKRERAGGKQGESGNRERMVNVRENPTFEKVK